MAQLEIIQIPVLDDNYVYLVHEPVSKQTAVVDPAVVAPVLAVAEQKGWSITHILNTHHHNDHTGGNLEIKRKTGCIIVGPKADRDRIPGIDVELSDDETFTLGDQQAVVYDIPGHTAGHISFWFETSDALFCGDTLFALGCGRVFEGTADQMWTSLSKLRELPNSTRVYCAHEYTQSNGRFALSVEPENTALVNRMADIDKKREQNISTVPSTIGEERETNPFFRPESAELQRMIGVSGHDNVAIFAETRRLKDSF